MRGVLLSTLLLCSLCLATACGGKKHEAYKDIEADRFRPASAKELAAIGASFEKSLNGIGLKSKVSHCRNASYMLPDSGRDISFGALCDVSVEGGKKGSSQALFMCDDEMVGKFALQQDGTISDEWVKEFTAKNCQPGN